MKGPSVTQRLRAFNKRRAHRAAGRVMDRYVCVESRRSDRLKNYEHATTIDGALYSAGRMAREIEQLEKDCFRDCPALAETLAVYSMALHTIAEELKRLREMPFNAPDEKAEPQKHGTISRFANWLGVSEIRAKGMLFGWLVVVPIVSFIVTMAANHYMPH